MHCLRFRRPTVLALLVLLLTAARAPAVTSARPPRASALRYALTARALFDRAFSLMAAQPRFHVHLRIVPYPYEDTDFWWTAPDRLEINADDGDSVNLHVGDVGCVASRRWVCGHGDNVPHRWEARAAVVDALLPLVNGPAWYQGGLQHPKFEVVRPARGRAQTIILQATGDPWLYPPACQGCGLVGPRPQSVRYRAVIKLNALGLPFSMVSTVTIPPIDRHGHARFERVQDVSITYAGRWSISVPNYPHVECRPWERSPRSWCMQP